MKINNWRLIPKEITGCYESEQHYRIIYDRDVREKNKISGLVEFLNSQYEQLLRGSKRGLWIVDKDLFENDITPIPIILSSEQPKKRYKKSDDWIAKAIVSELRKNYTDEEKEEIVKRIIGGRSFQDRISGMYCNNINKSSVKDNDDFKPDGPYIILYYRNTICSDEEDYKAWIIATLAHEYFHYLHDSYAGEEFNRRRKYRKQVTESLADFFSFTYALWQSEKPMPCGICRDALYRYAKERFDSWQSRFGSEWPYAFAYCFFYVNDLPPMDYTDSLFYIEKNGCIEKFNDVLKCSKTNMNHAYQELTWNVF